MIGIFVGVSTQAAVSGLPQIEPPQSWAFDTEPDGQISITQIGTDISITIAGSSAFDGTYDVTQANLDAGPVNLFAPRISGTVALGDTLSAISGLWIYTSDATPPLLELQWQRDGVDIPAMVNATYVLGETDEGADITLVQTASDMLGTQMAISEAVSFGAPFFQDTFDYPDGTILGDLPHYTSYIVSGTGRIIASDGVATHSDGSTFERLEYNGPLANDQFVELEIGQDSGNNYAVEVYMRRTDSQNWYAMIFGASGVYVLQRDSGTVSTMTNTYPAASDDRVRLEAQGTTIRLIINNVLQESFTSTASSGGTLRFSMRPFNNSWLHEIKTLTCGDLL